MDKQAKELVQTLLKEDGFYKGKIDGIIGRQTNFALIKAETNYATQGNYNMGHSDVKRNAVAYLQIKCKENGLDPGVIDGFWGARTEAASDDLYDLHHHGEIRWQRPEDRPNIFPVQYSEAFKQLYGSVDNVPLVNVRLPYKMRIAWDLGKTIGRFKAHKEVAEVFESIFVQTLKAYGLQQIQELGLDLFGGCYNKRKVRGGTKWSTHTWGISIDLDPARNKLRWGRDKAQLAKPEYEAFWNIVEDHGAVSLGREANYDWMHFQCARLK